MKAKVRELGPSMGSLPVIFGIGATLWFLFPSIANVIEEVSFPGGIQLLTATTESEAPERERQIRSLLEAGAEHQLQGAIQAALDAYERALTIAEELGNPALEAGCLLRLGEIYDHLGDYYQVITYFSQALELYRHLGDALHEAEALHGLGTCYSFLGQSQIALDHFEKALNIWPRPHEKSVTLTAIATIYDLDGKHEKAIGLFREAFSLRHQVREVGENLKLLGKASTLDRLATAYVGAQQLGRARKAYQSALTLYRRMDYPLGSAITNDNLGWLALDQNQPDIALVHFQRALPLMREIRRTHGEAHTLQGMALAYRRKGELWRATKHLEQAIEIIESLRSSSYSQSLRSSFLARREPFYELYIEVLMELHEDKPDAGFAARALAAAESFKARSLLDLLLEERAGLRQGADDNLLRREAELHHEMNAVAHRRLLLLQSAATPAEIANVEREQRALSWEYDALWEQRRAQWAEHQPPLPISTDRMQELLDSDTRLLLFALGTEGSFLWVVSPEQILSFRLPPRGEIEALARETYDWLTHSDQRGHRRWSGRDATARLSTTLLGSATAALQGKRLVVVPAGGLHYIPFAALPIPGGGSEAPTLVQEHEIITLPSVSVLEALRRRARNREPVAKQLAMVADPVFGSKDTRLTASGSQSEAADGFRVLEALAPERLEFSAREAQAILALVPPAERHAALGFDASRRAFLDGQFSDFRIVHLAVHGELSDDQPEFSHLVLSLLDPQGRVQDGRLYLHEIDDLHIPAELVVLSACNTALGQHVHGEGLIGMTRAFMEAGASRVLVSLWYVSDEATAELMTRFYQELLVRGRTPTAALRAAQVAMQQSQRWKAPYYWAGFVLQGEWRWDLSEKKQPRNQQFDRLGFYSDKEAIGAAQRASAREGGERFVGLLTRRNIMRKHEDQPVEKTVGEQDIQDPPKERGYPVVSEEAKPKSIVKKIIDTPKERGYPVTSD